MDADFPFVLPPLDKERDNHFKQRWASINLEIQSLTDYLGKKFVPGEEHPNHWFLTENASSRSELAFVLNLFSETAGQIIDGKTHFGISFIDRKDWNNVKYNPYVGLILKDYNELFTSKVSETRLKKLIILIMRLNLNLNHNTFMTKRKLYYGDKDWYGKDQHLLDRLIDDLAASMQIPRASLHISSTCKGLFSTNLEFVVGRSEKNGQMKIIFQQTDSALDYSLITNPASIIEMKSEAKFCLVIEKEAVFHDMITAEVHKKFNCILITGLGVPDQATRQFVSLVWKLLRIPIFCLTDGDPRGLEIMCIYRFGALSTAYNNENLATPQMKWLGILPSDLLHSKFKSAFECIDIDKTEMEESERSYDEKPKVKAFTTGLEKLSDWDKKSLESIKKRPYLKDGHNKNLRKQIETMFENNVKAGLELLSEVGHTFIWDWYLPMKLEEGKFV